MAVSVSRCFLTAGRCVYETLSPADFRTPFGSRALKTLPAVVSASHGVSAGEV